MDEQPKAHTAPAPNADTRIPVGMRPGSREYRSASLTVSMSVAVPEHMRERVREITHVFVPLTSRKQRQATALLNFVCQEADANKITLVLTAQATEGGDDATVDTSAPTTSQLIGWYEKFGFKALQVTPAGTFMARQVHEKPRIKPVTLAVAAALSKALH